MNRAEWRAPVAADVAHRRAGGRARYNLEREIRAMQRRERIRTFYRNRSGIYRGDVQALARWLGVSSSTISRDLTGMTRAGWKPFKRV